MGNASNYVLQLLQRFAPWVEAAHLQSVGFHPSGCAQLHLQKSVLVLVGVATYAGGRSTCFLWLRVPGAGERHEEPAKDCWCPFTMTSLGPALSSRS